MGKLTTVSLKAFKSALEYEPGTGVFRYRRTKGSMVTGSIAGTINARWHYRYISIGGVFVRAHRLAWAFVHNVVLSPSMHIDHINGDRDDNRIANLRRTTRSLNGGNAAIRCDSRSGIKGVRFRADRGKWSARLRAEGVVHHLGCFDTQEEAQTAYERAAEKYFGEFASHLCRPPLVQLEKLIKGTAE